MPEEEVLSKPDQINPEWFREELKKLEEDARLFISWLKATGNWEAIAQATLAMRHIEDARMRYWKVIQYLWDWNSIYDRK